MLSLTAPKILKVTKYLRDIKPPLFQLNGHLQTIVPTQFRKVTGVQYSRERITTPDGDFLDLDWTQSGRDQLIIICHGLEGNTSRAYIKGMVRYFDRKGWDVLAWNYRGCSEQINRKLKFYHSGATDDLNTVIEHVLATRGYTGISLLGFSLGGNMVLKFLGEQGDEINSKIKKALAISVPLDLHASCLQISSGINYMYGLRFLSRLKAKVKRKAELYPDAFNLDDLRKANSLIQFDNFFTAPLHGFKNAIEYYHLCSAQRFLDQIAIPTLIVNSRNDPFLAPSCYPIKQISKHPVVELLVPDQGGHCGFADRGFTDACWSEVLAWNYMNA